MKFIDLSKEDRVDILDRVSSELNIRQREVIEKDWWVTAVLRAMFGLSYADHLSFKGGTSLSKCWHLIDRFSEDIDVAIDREYLGFTGTLSKTQISDKLRRTACSFVRETMQHDLAEQLYQNGISKEKFKVNVDITPVFSFLRKTKGGTCPYGCPFPHFRIMFCLLASCITINIANKLWSFIDQYMQTPNEKLPVI